MKVLAAACVVVIALVCVDSVAVAQSGSCYNCYSDGTFLYCSLLQSSGGRTCKQPNPYTCTLVGACGGGGCFLAGTLIETVDGLVPIEYLQVGDVVVSRGEDSSELETVTVEHTFRSIQCGFYVINDDLHVTDDHPFFVAGEWVRAADLEVGDQLIDRDGNRVPVTSIQHVDKAVRAYNINVDETNTFFVEGILVHNKEPDPQG